MKKLLMLLIIGSLLLLIFGCSGSPPNTGSNDDTEVVMTQRPQFVDDRPQSVIESYVVSIAQVDLETLDKKPPKSDDPPDTGSTDPNPNPAHKYAYVVGISDYEGTVNDL